MKFWEVTESLTEFIGLTQHRGEETRSSSPGSVAVDEPMSSGSAAGNLQRPSSRLGVTQSSNATASSARTAQTKKPGAAEVQHTSGNAQSRGEMAKSASGKPSSSAPVAISSRTRPAASTGQQSKPKAPRVAHGGEVFNSPRDLEDEYNALMERVRDLEKSASERESELCQALDDAKIREQSLQKALADAERRLATATNDLATLRSLTVEDVDAHALLTLFDDLNDAVNEVAFRFINDLKVTDDVVRFSLLPKLQEADPRLHGLLALFLDGCAKAKLPVEQALVQAVQGIFYWILSHDIFRVFSPRVEKGSNAMLRDVQSKIMARETQEYSARWRSITYNALRGTANDEEYVSYVTETILSNTRLLIEVIMDSRPHNRPFAKLYEEARNVCAMALRWKDSACGSHLSYDYEVFIPFSGSFNEAEMRSDEIQTASGQDRSRPFVALTIAAGLIASRTGVSGPPQVVRKAQVVLLDPAKEDRMQE